MNNRELTYYSLASRAELRHIEGLADNTPQEAFIALDFENKHFHHLWIGANNEAFISTVGFITDLKKLNSLLTIQLRRYNQKDSLDVNSNKDWLKHTKFIFQDEYNKTQKEIFLEVVEWCIERLNNTKTDAKSNSLDKENKSLITFNKAAPDDHVFLNFYKKIGWVDKIEKETNLIINPTHKFTLLKERRLRVFEQEKQNFIEERNTKELDTSPKEMDTFYKVWLTSELNTMDDKFSTKEETVSNQIEINKYRQFVKDEIKNITQYYNVEKINTGYVNKYLEIYEAMFQEHLKVFDSNQEPNQVTINLLLNQDHEYHKGFNNEWQDKLLDLVEKKQDIHPYLRKIYVNGFMKIVCYAKRYDEKINTIPLNKSYIYFINFISGVNSICQGIRKYLILNFQLEIPLVSADSYNITGGYFKEFKVLSVTNQNPLPKEKKDNIQELPLAEFIALISDLKLLKKYTITIGREEIAEGTIKELKATFKDVDMPQINRIIQDIEENATHNYSSIEVHNYFKKLTNDFQLSEMKIVLNDMIAFRDMELFEDLDVLTMTKYRNEGWDIPTCEYESRRTGKISIITDTKKMRSRVFPLLGMLFFEAIYLLESKIDKLQNLELNSDTPKIEPAKTEKSLIQQKVENAFSFMLDRDPRQHKYILDENDYKNLINWVTFFFENELTIPSIDTPIQKVNTAKGNVFYTFKLLFKELKPSNKQPNELFTLIKKCFYQYREDKITNMRKSKEPNHYKQMINKNK